MTVDKIDRWIGGKYVHLKLNINGSGMFTCKLPPELVDIAGETKVCDLGLNTLKSQLDRILRLYEKKLREKEVDSK